MSQINNPTKKPNNKRDQLVQRWQIRIVEWFAASSDTWLKRFIKVCAVGLTTPATVIVAGELYPNQGALTLMIQFCALGLCEGSLLLGWARLESSNERQATTQQRWLYASLALVAYIVLWAVAWAHNEGLIGIAFRLTLGVLLIYSIFEAGLLANVRLQRSAEKDVTKDRKVRRAKHKAEVSLALAEIKSGVRVETLRIDVKEQSEIEAISPNYFTSQQKGIFDLFFSKKSPQITRISPAVLSTANRSTDRNENIVKLNEKRAMKKQERQKEIRGYMQESPNRNDTELAGWIKSSFGVSESTARADIRAVKSEMVNH